MTILSKPLKALLPVAAALLSLMGCSPAKPVDDKVVDIAGIVAPQKGKEGFIGGLREIQQDGRLDAELKKIGWKVNWVPVPATVGGPVVNEGFAAKTIDMAGYGDLPSIIAMAAGVDLRLVTASGAGSNIYLVVGPNSTARTLQDLKGKKIALHRGRPWEAGFARYVESQGMTLDDFKIINVNVTAGTAALTSGKIDAIVLIQAEGYVLEERGLGRILWSTRDAPESWKMLAGTFVRKEFLDAHPDVVQIVVNALVRQARWASLEENRNTVLGWSMAFGAPLSAVEKDAANSKLSWRERSSPIPKPYIEDHFRYVADYAARTGLTRTKVDVSNLIDPRFVDRALKDLDLTNWWEPAPGK